MLRDELLQDLQVRLGEADVAGEQGVDGAGAEGARSDLLVQAADADGRVVAGGGHLLDEGRAARGDPADADAGEAVGLGERARGDGVLVAERQDRRREGVVDGRDAVEDGAVHLVAQDGDGLGCGEVDEVLEEGLGENGTGGIVGVAWGDLLVDILRRMRRGGVLDYDQLGVWPHQSLQFF